MGIPSVEILIPWHESDFYRKRNFQWVCEHLPYPIILGSAKPFNKGRAFADALSKATAEILILHDADVYCNGLQEAVQAISDHPWAIPHRYVYRLNEAATRAYITGERNSGFKQGDLDRRPYVGIAGGGIVVARRDVFEDVPIDPRFENWGQEDESHGCALQTLYGRPWRGEAPLFHFHHPPQPRIANRWGSNENRMLYQNGYHRNARRPTEMRKVVEAAKSVL